MGLTVLGIGNALPDALTTIALAKEGSKKTKINYYYIIYFRLCINGNYGKLCRLIIWITCRIWTCHAQTHIKSWT